MFEIFLLLYYGDYMRKIIIGTTVIVLGLLISLGPQLLFKVCENTTASCGGSISECCTELKASSCCSPAIRNIPICYWTARAEIGMGLLIAALGTCIIIFSDSNMQSGLLIGTFLASIIALFIPHTLIGGCASMDMLCRKTAFPALTAISIVLLAFTAIVLTAISMKKSPVESAKI